MKIISLLIGLSLYLAGAYASADVLEVNVWKAQPGKGNAMFEVGKRAQAIHTKHGANVSIFRDMYGQMRYIVGFENWQAWNKWATAMNEDKEWMALIQEVNADPFFELQSNRLMGVIERSENLGTVVESYVWRPLPGKNATMFDTALAAKALHEKAGASVQVAFDKMDNLIYSLAFENWEAYAKFMDTPNPEFQAYMQKASETPSAQLIETVTASLVQ